MVKNNSTVREIVKKYLEDNGFDGLRDGDGNCGCDLSDLMPCDWVEVMNCEAGYKGPCNCGEVCDFHIYLNKPEENKDEETHCRGCGQYDENCECDGEA